MVITLVVTLIHGILNIHNLSGLAVLNQVSVFWSCAGLAVVMLVLSVAAEHRQFNWVFTDYENKTGFDSPIYVFMLGMIGAAYSLFGCECAASVNEETQDADIASPWAMTMSIVTAWFVGLIFLISLLFSIQDMDAILNTELHMPVAQLFQDAVGLWAAIAFLILMVTCQFCTGATTVTVASRQIYALARDNAAPMSPFLYALNHQKIPANAIWITTALTSMVVLPFPLSEHVFETIVSAATVAIHLAYALVLGCRLGVSIERQGRFSLGRYSTPITWIGFLWATYAIFAFMLPTAWPIEANNANYAGLGLFIVAGTTYCFWLGWGRFHYVGPTVMNDATDL
ncbi:amino acid/polyamine transporter I [Radiomyces spectabilis]|uniref:amino acid/polyamine transporter I n=1 Tax=Radiomyces spectabilis TaxID=64574 RepID=UPI00221F4935|nr:amino acid/polyamine transporter I [Radiomyces spectabilis]KAI8369508.1 amino acid/polyamine transporter I [Radiomyces spectabilis]